MAQATVLAAGSTTATSTDIVVASGSTVASVGFKSSLSVDVTGMGFYAYIASLGLKRIEPIL